MPARAQQGTAPGSAIVTTLALAMLNGPWGPGWRAVAFARTYPEAWAKMQALYARRRPSRGSSIQQPTSRDFTVGESPFVDTTPVLRANEVIE